MARRRRSVQSGVVIETVVLGLVLAVVVGARLYFVFFRDPDDD